MENLPDKYSERFPSSTTNGMPQPWDGLGTSREAYMADAREQERAGKRLVVETWVNGYPDPMCEGDLWFVDWLDYSDYRTGEHVGGRDPEGDEPNVEHERFLVVERRLMATD